MGEWHDSAQTILLKNLVLLRNERKPEKKDTQPFAMTRFSFKKNMSVCTKKKPQKQKTKHPKVPFLVFSDTMICVSPYKIYIHTRGAVRSWPARAEGGRAQLPQLPRPCYRSPHGPRLATGAQLPGGTVSLATAAPAEAAATGIAAKRAASRLSWSRWEEVAWHLDPGGLLRHSAPPNPPSHFSPRGVALGSASQRSLLPQPGNGEVAAAQG